MNTKQEIAIGIALQTQVLRICPIHNQLYCDEEHYSDDENMARAFAVAIELVNQHQPYAEEFHHDAARPDGLAEFHDRRGAGLLSRVPSAAARAT